MLAARHGPASAPPRRIVPLSERYMQHQAKRAAATGPGAFNLFRGSPSGKIAPTPPVIAGTEAAAAVSGVSALSATSSQEPTISAVAAAKKRGQFSAAALKDMTMKGTLVPGADPDAVASTSNVEASAPEKVPSVRVVPPSQANMSANMAKYYAIKAAKAKKLSSK